MFLTEVTSQGLSAILNNNIVERVNMTYTHFPWLLYHRRITLC